MRSNFLHLLLIVAHNCNSRQWKMEAGEPLEPGGLEVCLSTIVRFYISNNSSNSKVLGIHSLYGDWVCLLLNPAYGRQRLWETEACVCLSSRIVPGQSGLGRGSCLKKTKRGVYGRVTAYAR